MANHKSAEKRHRQSLKRRDRNRATKGAIRTNVKNAKAAISLGSEDKNNAQELLRKAESSLASAAAKGILHQKTASRKIKRLAQAFASSQN
jgi:small subunit ribosomal protein S20